MMKTQRKAVDPIIATLLLIAIAVAAGIIVYVYVNSLAGGLTQGGGAQVSDQLQLDAYNYVSGTSLTFTVRDVGSTSVSVTSVFIDGSLEGAANSVSGTCSAGANPPYASCTVGQTLTLKFIDSLVTAPNSGTSHTIKVETSTGGTSTFSVIAGRTG